MAILWRQSRSKTAEGGIQENGQLVASRCAGTVREAAGLRETMRALGGYASAVAYLSHSSAFLQHRGTSAWHRCAPIKTGGAPRSLSAHAAEGCRLHERRDRAGKYTRVAHWGLGLCPSVSLLAQAEADLG